MAPRVHHSTLHCNAKSAEACGLREFHIEIKPPIKHLGHFHPDTSAPVGSRPDPNTRFPRSTLLLLSASIRSPQPSSPQELHQLAPYDKAQVRARLKQGGFSLSTEQYDLVPGPWPIIHPANAPGHVLREFDPTDHKMAVLLNEGQWIHKPDHRDPLPDTVGLIPLIVHKSHYYPATSKDPNTWRRQQDENQSSPKGLTGYLLDPDLFQLIARGFCLQLPNIPFHAAHWRQPSCLRFQLHLASVMRVGQLQSLAAWRSLINPSPSRLPLAGSSRTLACQCRMISLRMTLGSPQEPFCGSCLNRAPPLSPNENKVAPPTRRHLFVSVPPIAAFAAGTSAGTRVLTRTK